MYKILIKTCSASNNVWNFYQEDGVDYVAASLEDMKPTALTLLKKYGKKNIKIIDQMSGQDMDNADVYIYDSTDNYEELSNRPYINGTEIVGQLTLEDLGIQPAGDYLNQNDLEEIENKINNIDLSAYATNTRVDEVEAQIENIDLTPYATKEFVSEEISNIDIPEVDLTNYATIQYVDNAIGELADMGFTPVIVEALPTSDIKVNTIYMVPSEDGKNENIYEEWMYINNKWEMIGSTSVDLSNYYTKDESIKTFVIERKFAPNDGQRTYSTIPDAELEVCNKMIECAIKGEPFVVYFKNLYDNSDTPTTFMYKYTSGYELGDTYFHIKMFDFVGLDKTDVWYRISVDTTTNQVVTTGTKILVQTTKARLGNTQSNTDVSGVWTFNNPTNDYQPATKKYVDDAVANIDVPDVDLSDYYNKTEIDDKLLAVDVNVEGLDIYSDEERVIGRWVDGRPLYQKYIYIGELTNGITDTHLDDYGIKAHEVRFHQVYKIGPDGILCLISPQFMSMAGKVIVRVLLYQEESGFNVLRVATGEDMDVEGHTAYAIVTYTKPDDEILLPTSDYYPATKKYVDDAVAGVSGGSGGGADLTNYYTKAEVDALLQELRNEFVSANNNINDKLETIIYGGE